MDSDLFKYLNEKQKEAVKHTHGPAVILAGAGSGKTRVIIHKVLHLVENEHVSPSQIVMITFTNKAAQEMKSRIQAALQGDSLSLGYVGTFHSFCSYVLRRDGPVIGVDHNFIIYDDSDQETIIKEILKSSTTKRFTPSYYRNRISTAKNMLINPERYLEVFSDYGAAHAAQVYKQYQEKLGRNHALDFDDLIMKVTLLFTKHPDILAKYQNKYTHLLVDEFQDTNYAQYVLTRLLGEKSRNVTVVGDFSQSIYSWRGADIRNLEKFKEDFTDTHIYNLEQNYRCTQNILNFAYDVISQNETHPILQLFTTNVEGEEVIFHEADNEQGEALYIANQIKQQVIQGNYNEFAVLYRTNAQSRAIEEAFLHYSIPYTLIGGVRFYERKEVKDVLSYLRLLINPTEEISLERARKLGKKRWEQFSNLYIELSATKDQTDTADLMERVFQETGYLDQYDPNDPEDYARLENIKELKSVALKYPKLIEFLEQIALVESEYSEGEKRGKRGEGVRLMTLHQAKGLEFTHVFISGVEEGILPHSRSVDDLFQLEEERRLFYVGITRAREHLYVTYARRRTVFGRRSETMKSRFIGGGTEPSWDY
ncbi:UvrD-helicase domain-containing protein [Candidatus Roizmanbacteria bacterium]|nr:UvrD-helicase domain-containing protein [Candidatus Roizmanbacteria bacterium]